MVRDENYICLHGWMLNRVKLSGNELLAYALIYGFSQAEGCRFSGSYRYISEWLGCCEKTAVTTIERLIEKNLVLKFQKTENGITVNEYEAVIPEMSIEKQKKEIKRKGNQKKAPLTEREPDNEMERIEKRYLENHYSLYQREKVMEEKPVINWGKSRKLVSELMSVVGVDKIVEVIDKAMNDKWVVENGYCLTTIMSMNVFNRLLNSKHPNGGVGIGKGVDEYIDSEGIKF